MPGPVSDAYDPEWGTEANGDRIRETLDAVYDRLSEILGRKSPFWILTLVDMDLPEKITAELTEKEWRLLRFAVERATESI